MTGSAWPEVSHKKPETASVYAFQKKMDSVVLFVKLLLPVTVDYTAVGASGQ